MEATATKTEAASCGHRRGAILGGPPLEFDPGARRVRQRRRRAGGSAARRSGGGGGRRGDGAAAARADQALGRGAAFRARRGVGRGGCARAAHGDARAGRGGPGGAAIASSPSNFGPEPARLRAAAEAWLAEPTPEHAGPPRRGRRAAAPGAAAAHEHGAGRHRRAGGGAPGGARPAARGAGAEAARLRPQAPARLLVQPRLPGAAPHRLADAGGGAGEADRVRGGARDPGLGRPAPAPGRRPALLRLLPPGAAGRAADLRRGGAGGGPGRGRAAAARARRGVRGRRRRLRGAGGHGDLLLHLELPGGPAGHLLRQLPDQAGGRGAEGTSCRSSQRFSTLSPVPGFRRWLDGAPRLGATRPRPPTCCAPRSGRRCSRAPAMAAQPDALAAVLRSDALVGGPGPGRGAARAADCAFAPSTSRRPTAGAGRATRWRASTSATAPGWSGSTGSATPPRAGCRNPSA